MAQTLSDLAERMKKLAGSLDKKAVGLSVLTAEAILKDLINVTPVDTSNALSNWQIGIGRPVSKEVGPYFLGFRGSTRANSVMAAYSVGMDKLEGLKSGTSIYISNLAPYIVDLNNGSSKQANAGFVERAVLVGRVTLKNAKISKKV